VLTGGIFPAPVLDTAWWDMEDTRGCGRPLHLLTHTVSNERIPGKFGIMPEGDYIEEKEFYTDRL
jgi:hypothetical protein